MNLLRPCLSSVLLIKLIKLSEFALATTTTSKRAFGSTCTNNRSVLREYFDSNFYFNTVLERNKVCLARRPIRIRQFSSVKMASMPVVDAPQLKYLNQNEAIQVDQDLFNEYKFSVDQLMELAGLSVATAVAKIYSEKKAQKVLVIAGPGNNGGDGLVAARHLKLFGFENVSILNARKPSKDLYINLLHQASENNVEVSYDPSSFKGDASIGLIIDALFGFSFKPPVRPDFQPLMELLVSSSSRSIPVVAVDIPSGWDVEKGPPSDDSIRFMPEMLVSLTAPKLCASHFQGAFHILGGRFVPKSLEAKYSLNLPAYSGTKCVIRLK